MDSGQMDPRLGCLPRGLARPALTGHGTLLRHPGPVRAVPPRASGPEASRPSRGRLEGPKPPPAQARRAWKFPGAVMAEECCGRGLRPADAVSFPRAETP